MTSLDTCSFLTSHLTHPYSRFRVLVSSFLSKPFFESIRYHQVVQRCCVDSSQVFMTSVAWGETEIWKKKQKNKTPANFNCLWKHLDYAPPCHSIAFSWNILMPVLFEVEPWQSRVRAVGMHTQILPGHASSHVLLLFFDHIKNWPYIHMSDREGRGRGGCCSRVSHQVDK